MITINPSVREPNNCQHVTVHSVLKHFKTKDKHGIDHLRSVEDKDQQNKLKMNLPVVMFAGEFSARNNKSLVKASGLMILDFDCESESESEKVLERIKDDQYIYSFFKSTRGLGWKALVKIPIVKDDAEYKLYWNAVEEYFPNVDTACKDICRACFYSYDPDLFVNPDSKVWNQKKEININKASKKISKSTDYGLMNRALNLIKNATVGERHNKILNASRLAGGWVASNKVDYQEAQRLLEQEAERIDPDDFKTNKKAIIDGLNNGMMHPIDDEKYLSGEAVKEKFDKIFWTLTDCADEIESKYHIGIEGGYKCGYDSIDEHYTLYTGYTTYIYGAPFSGKSQIWFDMLKNYSYRYGMRHAIFSPETGSAADVFIELIQMVAGGDFYDIYGNKISVEDKDQARDFVERHFIVIDPGMKSMTITELIASCEIIERTFNTKIHTLTIDPWNDLYHDMKDQNFREDKYLEEFLKLLRVTAHVNDWHICVITHTRDQQKERRGEVMFYPPATFREIAGGQTWSRRGFQMVSVWRPVEGLTEYAGMEFTGNETLWIQQKFKPKYAGKKGIGVVKYDAKKHCYYEGTNLLPRYAKLTPENPANQNYTDKPPF
jgi:hypothetical protein